MMIKIVLIACMSIFSSLLLGQNILCSQLNFKGDTAYLSAQESPFSASCVYYNEAGKITNAATYEKGLLLKETLFYANGNKNTEAFFLANKYNGLFTHWYETGTVKSIDTYVNDYKNGESKHYYENGQLESKGEYVNCFKTGHWLYYYETGQLKKEERYTGDESKEGEWNEWNEQGELTHTLVYKNNQLIN